MRPSNLAARGNPVPGLPSIRNGGLGKEVSASEFGPTDLPSVIEPNVEFAINHNDHAVTALHSARDLRDSHFCGRKQINYALDFLVL